MSSFARTALILAGAGSFLIAVLHLVVVFVGAPAYIYFGAVRLAELTQQFSWYPPVITGTLALVFFVWAVYAFRGAGVLHRHLPAVRPVLIAIGAIYTLRGVVLVADIARLGRSGGHPFRQTVFSAISLVLGILYLAGAAARREDSPAQAF